MSRAYHVVWLQQSQTVQSSDHLSLDVDLLDILPEAEMIALLKEQLKKDGWKDHGGELKITIDGLEISLSADGKSVTAKKTAEQAVTGRGTTKQQAKSDVESRAAQAEKQLSAEIAKELMKKEPKVREAIQKALQKVYLESLEKKARQMGDVESIVHSTGEDGEVEVVITVKA